MLAPVNDSSRSRDIMRNAAIFNNWSLLLLLIETRVQLILEFRNKFESIAEYIYIKLVIFVIANMIVVAKINWTATPN